MWMNTHDNTHDTQEPLMFNVIIVRYSFENIFGQASIFGTGSPILWWWRCQQHMVSSQSSHSEDCIRCSAHASSKICRLRFLSASFRRISNEQQTIGNQPQRQYSSWYQLNSLWFMRQSHLIFQIVSIQRWFKWCTKYGINGYFKRKKKIRFSFEFTGRA